MIVVFANQKGGCGKSTNCVMFANYVAEKGYDAMLFDFDFQRTIFDRRSTDKEENRRISELRTEDEMFDNEAPYEVVSWALSDAKKIVDAAKQEPKPIYIFDLPGRVDDDNLPYILKSADLIVIPFCYDRNTLDSTAIFIEVIRLLDVSGKLFFLPNRINKSVNYEMVKQQVIPILEEYGTVLPMIPNRVAFERVSTFGNSQEVTDIIDTSYSELMSFLNF